MNTKVTNEYTFQVVNWEQYFNGLIRERAFRSVEECNVQITTGAVSLDDPMGIQDVTYRRDYVLIEELIDPSKQVKRQLIDQVTNHGVTFEVLGKDFQESAEAAAVRALMSFVDIDTCVFVDLGLDGPDHLYMLAPTTRDELVLKLMNFSNGAVVVYTPKKFILFKCPTIELVLHEIT